MLRTHLVRRLSTLPHKKVDLKLVKQLRQRTAAPVKKCVDALQAANEDVDKAIAWLRKNGLKSAAKLAARTAEDGAVVLARHADGHAITLLDVSSETDSVPRNSAFHDAVDAVAGAALAHGADVPAGVPRHLDVSTIGALHAGDMTVAERLQLSSSTLGENIQLRQGAVLRPAASGGVVCGYLHNRHSPTVGTAGAIISLASESTNVAALEALGAQLCMHIVAAKPFALSSADLRQADLDAELDVLIDVTRAELKEKGQPADEDKCEKIARKRLDKFKSESSLLSQKFVVDESAGTIAKLLEAEAEELGASVHISGFYRLAIGEQRHPYSTY